MRRIGLFLFLSVLLFSCKKEDHTSWTTSWAAPVAHGRITLEDLIPSEFGYTDANGLWHLRIQKELSALGFDTLLSLPDTTISRKFVVPLTGGPFNVPPNANIITSNEVTEINMNGVGLREVYLKGGTLMYEVKSYVGASLQCIYTIDGLTYNGDPVVLNIDTQPELATTPDVQSGTVSLVGMHMDLSGTSGLDYNKLISHIVVKTSPDASGTQPIYGQDSIRINLSFVDPVVDYARGYFGNETYVFNEQIDLSGAAHLPQGSLDLSSAEFDVDIHHTIGVDAKMTWTNLQATNTPSNTFVAMMSGDLYLPKMMTRALDLGNGEVLGAHYQNQLNETNSNITQFLGALPDYLVIQGDLQINPLGNVSDGNDFFYGDHLTKATVNLDIPLRFATAGLSFTDTLDVSITTDQVQVTALTIPITSTFPVELTMQLLTEEGQVIASNLLIPAGTVDANGNVIQASETVLQVNISNDQWQSIKQAHRLILQANAVTPNYPTPIYFTTANYLDVKIIAGADITAIVH